MAEETSNTPTAEAHSVSNPSTKACEIKESPLHENPRFKEVIGQRNEVRDENANLKQQIEKYQADEKAKEEKLLRDKGEFQTILDRKDVELEKAHKKGAMWDDYEAARRKTLTESLPEAKQKFAVSMPLQDLEEFSSLESINANAGKTDSSRAGTTAKGEFGGYDSHADWASKDAEGYKQANMTPNAHGIKIGYGDN